MAQNYTFADILNTTNSHFHRRFEDDLASFICNAAQNEIWMAYDWRETLKVLPPFYLLPNEQDHYAPSVAVPADFLGLRVAQLVRVNSTPPFRRDLTVLKDLQLTHQRFLPHAVSFEPTRRGFRVFPRVPEGVGAADYMIEGKYKIRPVLITAANLQTTKLPFDDLYVQVWIEAMKWAGWSLTGDQRGIQQIAVLQQKVHEMASNEGLETGEPSIAPSEPLVASGSYQSPLSTLWGF